MISWIIIGRNWKNNLSDLFISINNQIDFVNCEIIFVDDFSTDNSINELENYANNNNFRLIKQKKHLGRSAARNVGINNAKGEWCIFTNSNIYVMSNFIYEYKKNIISNNIDIIAGGIIYECKSDANYEMYLNNPFRGINNYDKLDIIPPKYVLFGNCCVKKKLFNNTEFDESIKLYGGEEIELISRIIRKNENIKIIKICNEVVRKGHRNFINQCDRMEEFGYNLADFPDKNIVHDIIPKFIRKAKFIIPSKITIKILKSLYKKLPFAKNTIIRLSFGFCVFRGWKSNKSNA